MNVNSGVTSIDTTSKDSFVSKVFQSLRKVSHFYLYVKSGFIIESGYNCE